MDNNCHIFLLRTVFFLWQKLVITPGFIVSSTYHLYGTRIVLKLIEAILHILPIDVIIFFLWLGVQSAVQCNSQYTLTVLKAATLTRNTLEYLICCVINCNTRPTPSLENWIAVRSWYIRLENYELNVFNVHTTILLWSLKYPDTIFALLQQHILGKI